MPTTQAIFAAGCFWGVEAKFAKIPGVLKTEVGYTGGHLENPTYEQVCTGKTGHAESIRIDFDPDIISYEELLEVFWNLHNPTSLNRQGPDIGHQYRSAIFYLDETQKQEALLSIEDLEKSRKYSHKIVTEVVPAGPFYRAEEYHQKYLEKRGGGICH